MTDMIYAGLTIAIGIAAAIVFARLRVPAGEIIGPVLAVGALAVAGFPVPPAPPWTRVAVQITLGVVIGHRITKETLKKLRGIAWAALAVLVWSLGSAFGLGWLIKALANIDYVTAVLSCCPGGLPEMSVLAISFDAQPSVVVALQTVRVLAVLVGLPALVPALVRGINRWESNSYPVSVDQSVDTAILVGEETVISAAEELATPARALVPPVRRWLRVMWTFAIGACGGVLALWFGLPAAGLLGAMGAIGVAQVLGLRFEALPDTVQRAARMVVGMLIGTTISREIVSSMAGLVLPALVLTVVLVSTGLAVGLLVRRVTGWPIEVCILSSAAAGLVSMSAVAQSLGLDPVRISLLHLVRIVSLVVVVPLALAVIY